MGANQSVRSTQEINDASRSEKYQIRTMNGQKTLTAKSEVPPPEPMISTPEEESRVVADGGNVPDFSSEDDGVDEDTDLEEDDDEELLMERRLILDDARRLRQAAEFFYRPEKPVEADATACARCFFSRPSAPGQVSAEEEERDLALADALMLKKLAVDYLHPERPVGVSTDGASFGRNYFGRPSAPEVQDEEDAEEVERILKDMKGLKMAAEWYLQPEKPVVCDGRASGRNFFSRPAAPQVETEMEERELVLAEALALKKVAEWYLNPERPVEVGATATGRNFFTRASATDYQGEAEIDEQNLIMEELMGLKATAEWYLQPEKPVAVDVLACGRNYFTRVSAPECDEEEMDEERGLVLAEAHELKKIAQWYLQPEKSVVVDATALGRNYFTRGSALEHDESDVDEERELVLADAKKLKTVAQWYLQRDTPVDVDGRATGRNYFSRPSAPGYEEDDMEERELILKEMNQLKMTAEWYLHPEKPVVVDPCTTGRSYFTRPSASNVEEDESNTERDLILADASNLKKLAAWYLHPEMAVQVDSAATGRDFFSRPSAPELEGEESSERELVLADARQLKECAEWYLQPEKPVLSHGAATARNYFTRPSAPEYDSEEKDEERDAILSETRKLKEVANWYLHPETAVVSGGFSMGRDYFSRHSAAQFYDKETEEELERVLFEANELKRVADWYLNPEKPVLPDATATARNYFTRPSAPEYDDDTEEREAVLAEAMALKRVAKWYLQPEMPVVTDDPFAKGRNFFTRPSAYQDGDDNEEERELILAEAKELKKVAEWYMEPEKPVVETAAFSMGRNFFTRPSAPASEEEIYHEERERILAEALELKKVAEWYLRPENPVVVTDPCANGRNFFSRPSAPEYEDEETHQEHDRILVEAKEFKQVAEWYHHPETPVTSSITVTRNFFTRPSAEDALDEAEEEGKELILADAMMLKDLATDYLHPEKPVESSINCIRNYFDRPSAKGHSDYIHSEGYAIPGHQVGAQHLNEDQAALHDYYHHQDRHYSWCDDDDRSHHTQSDHFEMDEDVFHGFRESLYAVQEHMVPIIKEYEDGEGGNLSRSPSTVMLFDEAM